MITKDIRLSEVRLDEEEMQAIREVLKSGILREGKHAREFESDFCQRTGAKHAIVASSGTAALHLAYAALLKPGDEVIVPSFTFIATASMVMMTGAKPVFCDVDPKTWTLDPKEVVRHLTPKTRAIAGVHIFGNACDIKTLRDIALQHDLKIIWDAAQAAGTVYQTQDVACFRDVACFSFYPSKNITTGEGGMVATNDDDLAYKVRLLKSHGESDKYVHSVVGFNYRMSEIEAAIGLIQLRKLDDFIKARKQVAEKYRSYFSKSPHFQLQEILPECNPSYNYFSVLLNLNDHLPSRNQFVKLLQGEGIPCAVHYPRPLHLQPCFEGLANWPLACSEDIADRVFSLPIHPYLSDSDMTYIIEKIHKLI